MKHCQMGSVCFLMRLKLNITQMVKDLFLMNQCLKNTKNGLEL